MNTTGYWGDALSLGNPRSYAGSMPTDAKDPWGLEVYSDNFIGPLLPTDRRQSEVKENASEYYFEFDGSALNLKHTGGDIVDSVPAVSGIKGKYDALPPGRYTIGTHINRARIPWPRSMKYRYEAWGHYMWRLTAAPAPPMPPAPPAQPGGTGSNSTPTGPTTGNYPHGGATAPAGSVGTTTRGGFYIHGGTEPGSAGCIDVTEHDIEVYRWWSWLGRKVLVEVKYD